MRTTYKELDGDLILSIEDQMMEDLGGRYDAENYKLTTALFSELYVQLYNFKHSFTMYMYN